MNAESRIVPMWWTVAAGVPTVLVATSLSLQAAWWDQLPARMPKHWNASGTADAFGTRWSTTIATLVVGVAVPALMIAITAPHFVRGARGWVYRFMAAMGAGMSALGAVLAGGLFWVHRGVPEGGPWPRTGWVSAAAFGAAIVVGVIGFLVQPRQESNRPMPLPAESLQLGPTELAVWIGEARIPRRFLLLLALVTAAVAGGAVGFFIAGVWVAGWIYVGLVFLLVLLTAATSVFRVRVDASGLEAVSALGWPRLRVPMGAVDEAAAVSIDGLSEFGGYGIRLAPGAFGIVLRNGEALQVKRSSGRRVVITLDDAATAAALLNALKARA